MRARAIVFAMLARPACVWRRVRRRRRHRRRRLVPRSALACNNVFFCARAHRVVVVDFAVNSLCLCALGVSRVAIGRRAALHSVSECTRRCRYQSGRLVLDFAYSVLALVTFDEYIFDGFCCCLSDLTQGAVAERDIAAARGDVCVCRQAHGPRCARSAHGIVVTRSFDASNMMIDEWINLNSVES
jgi:hypothetical protein